MSYIGAEQVWSLGAKCPSGVAAQVVRCAAFDAPAAAWSAAAEVDLCWWTDAACEAFEIAVGDEIHLSVYGHTKAECSN
jgi:hypothetical protein